LAIGPDGFLYVGQGENFGEPYVLVGSDGSRQNGGGEGGNIFRCRPDGSVLHRWATGFWNPFGLHFDAAGRLWAVCNDPDARPPCRLLHVVQGADFGFQFRFGRAGTHPLQAWDGEQPGTLPMAAGTGEAPSAVVSYEDALWVTSWGDNRLEKFQLEPNGASWKGAMQVVVQGGSMFRPVDFAVAGDGSIYFTDWVDRSYPVHGKGRLWRLIPRTASESSAAGTPKSSPAGLPPLTDAEQWAARLADDASIDVTQRLSALDQADRFLVQAAVIGLTNTNQIHRLAIQDASTPAQLIGLMTAWRWLELTAPKAISASDRSVWIAHGLEHESSAVCRAAIRWAAERGDQQHLPAIRAVLERDDLPDDLFASAVAAIAYLETGSAARGRRDPAQERLLQSFLNSADQPTRLRAMAIRMLPTAAETPTEEQLMAWLQQENNPIFAAEVVRLLAARGTPESAKSLASIAQNDSHNPETRADAIAALGRQADAHASLLDQLSQSPAGPIRQEVQRVLQRDLDSSAASRPAANDLDAWEKLIGNGGDARAGWRVFARTTCINCHIHSGRGSEVGPDLTLLAGQMDRRRIIESILQPSKEVGPLYVSWRVLTEDGRVLSGVKLNAAGVGNRVRFAGADGNIFEVPLEEIREQQPSEESIMPRKLEETMSIDEFRDLVAFLAGDATGGAP
jgi:putative heme-binding domain-containing protein